MGMASYGICTTDDSLQPKQRHVPDIATSYQIARVLCLIRRIYVILRKRRIVPSVVGENGNGMALLIHHRPSKY
eukprot:6214676-Pleurochrysis_carterae.AAC.1